ncbi:hypothetical protein PQX77_009671 [Marasmius sp. AFHP31]|nr:hypothetical protein PQX77_009671 [Marasmius sp. AFHP31]
MLPSPSVIRIQGESGYVRVQLGTPSAGSFISSQTCSFLPGGQAGCVDVVNFAQASTTQLAGGSNSVVTNFVPSTTTLSTGEATLVPVATIEATTTVTSTLPPPSNQSLPGLADESGSKNNIIGPAVGGSLGGLALILLILAVYWFCKRRKRHHSTRSQTGSRGLIGGGLRGGNNGGHTVLDGGESEYKYHYRSSRMAVTSPEKDALSINSSSASYTNSNYQTHSPSHSYIGSLPAPTVPFRASHPPTSPLSTLPVRSEEVESLAPESTIDTIVSQPTIVAQPVRQNTAESTVSSASHPGHGFRIHPSRFIERLSLSSTYLESLTAGGLLVDGRGGHNRETTEQEGEGGVISDEPVQNEEFVAGHSHSSAPTHPPTLHPHPYRPTSPPSPSPPPSPRSFAPPTQPRFPHPTHSSSTSSLPLPSTSRTVDPPHLHSPRHTPSTPSFPQSATPRSWVSPSPFSYQSFQTASEGLGDDDTSTIEQERRQTPDNQTQYGFAV